MNKYNINSKTMAILSNDKGESIIYEETCFFIVKCRPTFLIKKSCQMYGKSLESAIQNTKRLIGVNYKAPIILNEYENTIYFPTKSIRLANNEWICLNKIKNYYENKRSHKTFVEFNNGKILEFDISYNIMNNQILRAYFLQSKNQLITKDNI